MAGYNPPGGGDSNGLHAMLARLQAQRNAQNNDDPAVNDILTRFTSYNQGLNLQDYYGHSAAQSPLTGLDDFPPPAPTPPSNFSHSHHPTGLGPMGLGPIGTMPSSNASKADQSTNLLNLLKFSGQTAQPQAHASSGHASFDTPSNKTNTTTNPANQPPIHAPVPMPADPQGLLATLMKGNMGNMQSEPSRVEPQVSSTQPAQPAQPTQPTWNTGPPPLDTQAYLLNLLHRPKPAQTDQQSANESSQPPTLTPQSGNGSSVDHHKDFDQDQRKHYVPETGSHDATPLPFRFGAKDHVESPPTKFEYHHSPISQLSQHNGSLKSAQFDFPNPLEELHGASPQNAVFNPSPPGPSAPAGHVPTEVPTATAYKIAKKGPSNASSPGLSNDHKRLGSQRSPIASPEHSRRRLDDSPHSVPHVTEDFATEEKTTETVSEAITELAETADKEAQEALERAENEEVQAKIGAELEHMMRAKTDAEFQDSAEVAAKTIKHELEKEENAHVLEDTFSPEDAQAIRDIVDDVAQGPVADSWESAEADEIVVIEETPNPVKVYQFPMKPWISIAMQETEVPRPQFRDEAILDIARLKKEFDQIDRNLVTASESYMAYGMSKAGGLRVIRQDDGKDAKLFTDTKDRIFNVTMSWTPSDFHATPKESIIGTGISGTVYYVQIKNGEKDYLEDAHIEQYGFVLPPVTISHEGGGDNGGVLKTRARTSSAHPDFFAVGRGKTINIIWPAYVTQNNMFKSARDRIVDTERLYRECSLKISTGKAGKDFTFSQDDTTIVSLDKSGRVKFWDVRDLTAADESGDSRFPTPAHTSVEVKEPLMTLNTTPEGEKAWPTSVLLLDKQRPYQKGWALRYMIVGMKQNHTLQLWDLALGKPVQEYSLPHSKESDPVCSVVYHPPTGMIVVGHPTRNSIYFLHLSAPKYTIKGLSQVDYVQKLVSKDSSIPEPDSTAVISGVREYSFANKGVLRSLDILVNPATTSPDGEEQPLFELYSMHSKGVTGVVIRQSELGWSKDNKVVEGVDAVEAGLVKIGKLKELPNALVSESQPAEDHAALPQRTRSVKATPPPQVSSVSSSQEQPQQKAGDSVPFAGQYDRKDVAAGAGAAPGAAVSAATTLDKTEKKARKKREKAAAAAAAAAAEKVTAENPQSNGSSQSPRVDAGLSKQVESKVPASSSQPAMSHESIQSTVKQIVSGLSEQLTGVITTEFKGQRDNVDAEFRARDERFFRGQQVLLDKVSTVLDANVQAVLMKTISDQFEDKVVPALSGVITRNISEQLDGKMSGRLSHAVQNQIQKFLPNAVSQAFQKPELTKVISDKVAMGVAIDMEKCIQESFVPIFTPIVNDAAIAASSSVVQEIQERSAEQIAELEQRRLIDSNKIDQLTALVTSLSETVTAMAATQAQFQDGLLKMQQQVSHDRTSAQHSQRVQPQSSHVQQLSHASQPRQLQQHPHQTHHTSSLQLQSQSFPYGSPTAASVHSVNSAHAGGPSAGFTPNYSGVRELSNVRDPETQHMIANIASFMERGDYETGLVRWIQEGRRPEVFNDYLVKLNPEFLPDVPTLVSLSVASVIAEQLEGPMIREKLNWVEMVLRILQTALPSIVSDLTPLPLTVSKNLQPQDPHVREVVPNLMTTMMDRFEKLYVQLNNLSPSDPIFARIAAMTNVAKQIRNIVLGSPQFSHSGSINY
ncbi:hypothetical protein GGR54DRAFT_309587 [Hypoxylon sp. NC1633]|nr:hypothetical protein GGR54DRAFT_309587 [Hypoxylon sp. NC1633]